MPSIRDFQPEDYNKLITLWQELGLGRPERGDDLEVIRETLRRGGKLLIMEEKGQLVGTAWITNNGRRLYLHHMGIREELQGKGHGKMLMKPVLDFAREQGMQIKLEVHEQNPAARKLYEEFGFKELDGYRVLINRNVNK